MKFKLQNSAYSIYLKLGDASFLTVLNSNRNYLACQPIYWSFYSAKRYPNNRFHDTDLNWGTSYPYNLKLTVTHFKKLALSHYINSKFKMVAYET